MLTGRDKESISGDFKSERTALMRNVGSSLKFPSLEILTTGVDVETLQGARQKQCKIVKISVKPNLEIYKY